MGFLSQKYQGILRRIKLFSLGVFYLKSSRIKIPNSLKINGHFKKIKFLDKNEHNFSYEFHSICIDDCYHLQSLKKLNIKIETVVDIGANQSLFMIAARRAFPGAKIFGYEPNKELESILTPNAEQLKAQIYYEAVTKEDCMVQLEFGQTDLNTISRPSTFGKIIGTSLRKVIERAGGKIDLLKMDCEGAEWDLFEDEAAWKNIKALTMEYHLWAKEGSTFNDVVSILRKLDFKMIFHEPSTENFGIVTAVKDEV